MIIQDEKTIMQSTEMNKHFYDNPYYLFYYANVLNQSKRYDESNIVLFSLVNYLNDYDIQMLIGENYFEQGLYNEAREAFRYSSNMCPNRFRSLWYLMRIEMFLNNEIKAVQIAKIILTKPVKVESDIINQIKDEASKCIQLRKEM